MKRMPIPRKSVVRSTYMRPAAERICPQARRRATRSGATGCHVVRTAAKTARARIPARTSSVVTGSLSQVTSAREPVATAWQKKSVASVPKTPPVGTA